MTDVPSWLPDMFADLNARHFDGRLPLPPFAVLSLNGWFGFYAPKIHMISLHPRTLDQDRAFVADTLLHEMVHYALEVETGDHEQNHGPRFVEMANRIGNSLGLRQVQLGSDSVLEWPQSVRPADHAPWRGPDKLAPAK
ncbi:MAG: SprT-like domain-containing protein [Polyangiaceae bacterium]